MKIYILRHEDRTQDCSFFSPLTKKGLENSLKLVDRLEEEKINKIYCSPFIRTLQTINPFAKKHNIKVNIEYGLSELHNEEIIAKKAVGVSLPEYLAESFNYNPEYKTLIKPTNIIYPEKEKHAQSRTNQVLRKIIIDNFNTKNNIIIVSHQIVCISILKVINKKFNSKIDKSIITNYDKGKLCLVFDSTSTNYWTFKAIN